MIHPFTKLRFVSESIGHGVFVTAAIPRGTIVWARDPLDRVLSPELVESLEPGVREAASRYCYRDAQGCWVLCWDHARYVNHSFEPNCMPTPYGFEVVIRDIAEGEELTNDYGCFNIIESFQPDQAGEERSNVHSDDLQQCHADWDRFLADALNVAPSVEQPLRGVLGEDTWARIQRIAAGEEPLLSLKTLLFNPAAGEQ